MAFIKLPDCFVRGVYESKQLAEQIADAMRTDDTERMQAFALCQRWLQGASPEDKKLLWDEMNRMKENPVTAVMANFAIYGFLHHNGKVPSNGNG